MRKEFLILVVCVTAALVCCERDDELYDTAGGGGTGIHDIIKFASLNDSTADADTTTIIYFETMIHQKSATTNRQVTFSTNVGHFLNLNDTMVVTADANGLVRMGIKSAQPGKATVSATVKSLTISRTFSFIPAKPDILIASADKYLVTIADSIVITTKLLRDPGRGVVNDPTRVWFTIRNVNDADADLPVLSSYAESDNQTASVTVKNPFAVTGTFEIEAKAQGEHDTVSTRVKVRIQ